MPSKIHTFAIPGVKFVRKSISNTFITIAFIALAGGFLPACKSTKVLKENEYLLIKNTISFTGKNPGISSDELSSIAKPKPNKKFIGTARIKFLLYFKGTQGKVDSKFRTWLREKAGERPAIYDSMATITSAQDMVLYLNKVGYFYSGVTISHEIKGKKKIKVTYHVTPSEPYRFRTIDYVIEDTLMAKFINKTKSASLVRSGEVFNAFNLDDERDRITEVLLNNGYYYFTRDYIYYEIDSTVENKEMNVKVRIRPNKITSPDDPNAYIFQPHRRYFINNIFIRPGYDPLLSPSITYDSLKYTFHYGKKKTSSDYFILHTGKIRVNPSTVSQSIFIKQGDPYRMEDVKKTRSRINELGLFSYNSIKFKEIPVPDSVQSGLLDCNIDLSRKKLHSFTVETEVTNSGEGRVSD